MIYSLYIFNRNGNCLFVNKWNAPNANKPLAYDDPEEEKRLLFGLLFSMKEFVQKLAPMRPVDPAMPNGSGGSSSNLVGLLGGGGSDAGSNYSSPSASSLVGGGGPFGGSVGAGSGTMTSSFPPESLQRFQTQDFTCHHYETPSGFRFVLLTDPQAGDLSAVLKYIYSHLFVEYVVNNPLSDLAKTKTINNQMFISQLKQYIEALPCFR